MDGTILSNKDGLSGSMLYSCCPNAATYHGPLKLRKKQTKNLHFLSFKLLLHPILYENIFGFQELFKLSFFCFVNIHLFFSLT